MRALIRKALRLLAELGLVAQVGYIYTSDGKTTVILVLEGVTKSDIEGPEEK